MKVGVRIPPAPPSDRLERLIRKLVDGGVDSLWWSDHLMSFSSPELWDDSTRSLLSLHEYVDPFVVMAWCSRFTGSVTLGTCVTDPIRRVAASLLQTALTLDHLTAGTIVLGLGAGEIANYGPYGVEVDSPADVLDHAARQIRRFVDDPGPDECGAIVALRPRDAAGPPQLWLAAHGPRGLRLAGEVADGWFPWTLDVETWTRCRDTVTAAALAAGRSPAAITMAMSIDVVVQDTATEARSLLTHPAVKQSCLLLPPSTFARYNSPHPLGGSATHTLIPTLAGPALADAARAVPDEMARDLIIHGTVDDVVEQIERYDGLGHVRLSDLGSAAAPGGSVDRLLAITRGLQRG